MLLAAMHPLSIKDLKDLRVYCAAPFYRHAGPNGPEEASDRGGQAPALRFARPSPFHRRARACPSPCLGWGNGVGWRSVFA